MAYRTEEVFVDHDEGVIFEIQISVENGLPRFGRSGKRHLEIDKRVSYSEDKSEEHHNLHRVQEGLVPPLFVLPVVIPIKFEHDDIERS